MGVSSNVEVFLSEKHVIDHKMDHDSTLLQEKPTIETLDKDCLTPTHERHEAKLKPQQLVQERDQEQQKKEVHACMNLRLEIPPYKNDQEDSYDGVKTPISEEHKIPTILQCPPAPRKRKMLSSTKEIKGCHPRVLDFTRLSMDLDVAATNKKLRNLFMGA
ncbi:hypothetical protein Lal_00034618 [Lupinus albus]|uniref:Uncharacterized protein n=1 Tax=Lupinus albus TaxID=3870 RepID=A0A6A4QRG2_LUPAL|nr:hypothetical protein Lalb_Chr03g0026661 [Lupinus albus]KAF1896917.1 hypothetical protein Lal_00034618 [Lupinus albus]